MTENPLLPDQSTHADAHATPKNYVTVFGGKIYLTRQQVPLHYPISEHTLAMLASKKRGPTFYKPTDRALYLPADIETWIEAAAVIPVSDPPPHPALNPARAPKAVIQKGRGRAKQQPKSDGGAPSGRRLKSLPPTADSWLRRHERP